MKKSKNKMRILRIQNRYLCTFLIDLRKLFLRNRGLSIKNKYFFKKDIELQLFDTQQEVTND